TQRIGFITSFIVPVMAIIYKALGFVIIGLNIQKLPQVLSLILSQACDLRAIAGGFAGSAIVIGIKRGLFSIEAGMGSAPNAAATAQVSHPVNQGTVQVLS
ncbi:alanine:cation symporter family protein, partial [Bittarella massiliensis (ex Durand et al. 2017)]